MIALQAAWLAVLADRVLRLVSIAWHGSRRRTFAADGEPDLVGYSIWVIFLSLGFFTVWALRELARRCGADC